MNITRNQFLTLTLLVAFFIASCNKSADPVKPIIDPPDQIESLVVRPGTGRASVAYSITDPDVVRSVIYWDNMTDSVVVTLPTLINGKREVEVIISPLKEGNRVIDILSYNAAGIHIASKQVVTVYGDSYRNNLSGRTLKDYVFIDDQNPYIEWTRVASNDSGIGLEYTKADGNVVSVVLDKAEMSYELTDYRPGTDIRYRTIFVPVEHALDTFYTDYETLKAPRFFASDLSRRVFLYSGLADEFLTDYYTVIQEGIEYAQLKFRMADNRPLSVDILRVDLDKEGVNIHTIMPNGGTSYGFQTISQMSASEDHPGNRILAAINADYYMEGGVPRGALYKRGNEINRVFTPFGSGPEHTYFGVMKNGSVRIGSSQDFSLLDRNQWNDVVGGRERLILGGNNVFYSWDTAREPRTSIGITTDEKVYMIVVDGRQASHSVGVLLDELTAIMASFGLKDAINLDGGGSSTMVKVTNSPGVFQVLNKPSGGSERAVANGLAVFDVN